MGWFSSVRALGLKQDAGNMLYLVKTIVTLQACRPLFERKCEVLCYTSGPEAFKCISHSLLSDFIFFFARGIFLKSTRKARSLSENIKSSSKNG